MDQSTNKESPDRETATFPSRYGRAQFAKEAGAPADEEYAAEFAPPRASAITKREEKALRTGDVRNMEYESLVEDEPAAEAQSRSLGIVGFVLAAISLFFLPAVLGPASVVVGFAAYVRGNRTLGIWTMVLGILAVAAYYVLVPYYA